MPGTIISQKESAKVLSRYAPYVQNNIALFKKAKKGLLPEAVFDFILISGLSNEQLEMTLNKSLKTFQNYREKNTTLDTTTSEKLLKLFSLYQQGAEVFGSLDSFNEWLSKPSFGLGNQIPNEILDSITGMELIRDELTRIAYGDLA